MKRKNVLAVSVSVLILCAVMMTGTTLAWFTSSVGNTGNKVKSGTLDVDMMISELENGVYSDYVSADSIEGPVFSIDKFEPGYSDAVKIKLANNGSLAVKYSFELIITESWTGVDNVLRADEFDAGLYKHLDSKNAYSMLESCIEVYQNGLFIGTLRDVTDYPELITGSEGVLFSEEDCPDSGQSVADLGELLFKMPDDAGNEFENSSLKFDISLKATQYTYEKDGFDSPYYDIDAFCAAHSVVGTGDTVLDSDVCTVTIPEGTDNVSKGDMLYLYIEKVSTPAAFTGTEYGYQSYRIRVLNQNSEEISGENINISLMLGKSDNTEAVHSVCLGPDNIITNYNYSSDKGSVKYNTDSFGIFTFEIDADAVSDGYFYEEFADAAEKGGIVDVIRDVIFDDYISVTEPLILNAYDYNISFSGSIDYYNDVVFYIEPESEPDNGLVTFNGGNYYVNGCCEKYEHNYFVFYIGEDCVNDVTFSNLKVDADITALGLCNKGRTFVNNCVFVMTDETGGQYAFDIERGNVNITGSRVFTDNAKDAVMVSQNAALILDSSRIVSVFGAQPPGETVHSNINVQQQASVSVKNCNLKSISDSDCYNVIVRNAEAEIYDSELSSNRIFAAVGCESISNIRVFSGKLLFSHMPVNTVFLKDECNKIEIPGSDSVLDVYCNADLDDYCFNTPAGPSVEKVLRPGFSMEYDSAMKLYKTVK